MSADSGSDELWQKGLVHRDYSTAAAHNETSSGLLYILSRQGRGLLAQLWPESNMQQLLNDWSAVDDDDDSVHQPIDDDGRASDSHVEAGASYEPVLASPKPSETSEDERDRILGAKIETRRTAWSLIESLPRDHRIKLLRGEEPWSSRGTVRGDPTLGSHNLVLELNVLRLIKRRCEAKSSDSVTISDLHEEADFPGPKPRHLMYALLTMVNARLICTAELLFKKSACNQSKKEVKHGR